MQLAAALGQMISPLNQVGTWKTKAGPSYLCVNKVITESTAEGQGYTGNIMCSAQILCRNCLFKTMVFNFICFEFQEKHNTLVEYRPDKCE